MIMQPLAGPTVVLHLMGGLGNQMFQYAFGRRLALANSADLVLDATGYGPGAAPDPERGIRTCALQHFRIEGRIIYAGESATAGRIPIRRWMHKALHAVKRIFDAGKPYYQRQEIVEPRDQQHKLDRRVRDRRFRGLLSVRGFWQTEGYFADIQEKIRAELTVQNEMRGKNLELADRMQKCESVAIHVRHGDNANSVAAELGVLDRDYYERAVDQLSRIVTNPQYFVFSEDIRWARRLLDDNPTYTFVDHNDALSSHEDLRLMTVCKHHIIANSTFGWWGAWLGKKEGQVVVAPRRYYLGVDRPNPDLYPQGWRLI